MNISKTNNQNSDKGLFWGNKPVDRNTGRTEDRFHPYQRIGFKFDSEQPKLGGSYPEEHQEN